MKIGETLAFPHKQGKRKFYVDFYLMAKKAGIRVSIKSIDNETMRLTRVSYGYGTGKETR